MGSGTNRDSSPVRTAPVLAQPVITAHLESLPVQNEGTEVALADALNLFQETTKLLVMTVRVADHTTYQIGVPMKLDPSKNEPALRTALSTLSNDIEVFRKELHQALGANDIEHSENVAKLHEELQREHRAWNDAHTSDVDSIEQTKVENLRHLEVQCEESLNAIQAELIVLERRCVALREEKERIEQRKEQRTAEIVAEARKLHEQEEEKLSKYYETSNADSENRLVELCRRMKAAQRQSHNKHNEKINALRMLESELMKMLPSQLPPSPQQEEPDQELPAYPAEKELHLSPRQAPVVVRRKSVLNSSSSASQRIQKLKRRSSSSSSESCETSSSSASSSSSSSSSSSTSKDPKTFLDNSDSKPSSLGSLPPEPPKRMLSPKPSRRSTRLAKLAKEPFVRKKKALLDEVEDGQRIDQLLKRHFQNLVEQHHNVLIGGEPDVLGEFWCTNTFFDQSYERFIKHCWESEHHDLEVGQYIEALSHVADQPQLIFQVERMQIQPEEEKSQCDFCPQQRTDKIHINNSLYRSDTNTVWYADNKCAERFRIALEFIVCLRELSLSLSKLRVSANTPLSKYQLNRVIVEHWPRFRQAFLDIEIHVDPDLSSSKSGE